MGDSDNLDGDVDQEHEEEEFLPLGWGGSWGGARDASPISGREPGGAARPLFGTAGGEAALPQSLLLLLAAPSQKGTQVTRDRPQGATSMYIMLVIQTTPPDSDLFRAEKSWEMDGGLGGGG